MSRPRKAPTHCTDCKRKFRPYKSSWRDYPGMPKHAGHGRCDKCRDRKYKADMERAAQGLPVDAGFDRPFTDEELAAMPAHAAMYHLSRRPFREAMRVLS